MNGFKAGYMTVAFWFFNMIIKQIMFLRVQKGQKITSKYMQINDKV